MGEQALLEGKKIVMEFAERVTQRFGDWIKQIIFFGSWAQGRPKPGSDYDLLLVVRSRDGDLIEQLYDEVLEFLLKYGVDLSLKIYTEEAFQKGLASRVPFLRSVTETGLELWNVRQKK